MNIDKSKSKLSTIALILLLTISATLVALPTIRAQDEYIRITGPSSTIVNFEMDISFEVRDSGGRISYAWEDVMFGVKSPGSADFIWEGPYSTTSDGRTFSHISSRYFPYTPTELGTFEFMWNVTAQGPLTSDLSSEILEVTVILAPQLNPYPYINAVPNPVQINTPTLFHVGSVYPAGRTASGKWYGLTVEVTFGGETTILPPVDTDATGGTGVTYTPTMAGTYYVRTHFPEQVKQFSDSRSGPAGTIMLDSYSDELEFIVQAEPIEYYPTQGLPSEYWTRPISGQIREWYTISAPWLQVGEPTSTGPTSMAAPYNELAPESAHILFRKPLTVGGLAGGPTVEHGFEQGDAYVGKFNGIVILGGRLFYNQYESQGGSNVEQEVVCVDLHTGEELWRRPLIDPDGNNRRLSFGQQFYWTGYNYHGVFDFLIATSGSNWHFFDTFSGRWVMTYEDVPSGTRFQGPNGEWFIYSISTSSGDISLWNSARVVSTEGSWNPAGLIRDADPRGVEWTVNVPELATLPGSVYKVRDGIILGTDFQRGSATDGDVNMWVIAVDNLQPENTGLLWHNTWTPPSPTITVEDVSLEEDLFIVSTKESRVTYGFRLSSGEELWGPTPSRHYTDNWGHSSGNSWDIILGGENKVIAGNYGGQVWCYNAQTGVVEWIYNITDPYTEILHNNRWRFRPSFYTDGKLYIENTEHNPRDPQPRGAPILCLDIDTGDLLWQLPYRQGEWSSTMIIGDSIIVAQNTYDQHIYAIGTGPSKTTVEAPLTALTQGSSVIIRGTVMDVSPGTTDPVIAIRFPDGVPAMSDASMTDYMKYVYNQITPINMVEGVEVFVSIQDPNGDYHSEIVTTDINGVFSMMWAPAIVGEYTVTAMFEGSKSYFGSKATTAFGVDQAAETPSYQGPSADEIAQKTVSQIPAFPDVPTAEEIAADSAQRTINMLPAYPEMPDVPEIPAYLTIDLVILVIAASGVVIGLIAYMALRKQK